MFKSFISILVVLLLLTQSGYALADNIVVPEGRTMEVITETAINSEVSKQGDAVVASLQTDFYDDGQLIFPAYSKVYGKISFLKKADFNGQDAELSLQFFKVETPDGTKYPISAIVETKDGSGVIFGKGESFFKKFGKTVASVGKKTAIQAAKSMTYNAIVPEDIRQGISYARTGIAGVGVVSDIKQGDYKEAAKTTAKEVVKYTPLAASYKYTKAAVKGIQQARASSENDGGTEGKGFDVVIQPGKELELLLLQTVTVSR